MGVDPISDQFPHVTTYNYAENEPIAHIDLWGLQKVVAVNRVSTNSEGEKQSIDRHEVTKPNNETSSRNRELWETYANQSEYGTRGVLNVTIDMDNQEVTKELKLSWWESTLNFFHNPRPMRGKTVYGDSRYAESHEGREGISENDVDMEETNPFPAGGGASSAFGLPNWISTNQKIVNRYDLGDQLFSSEWEVVPSPFSTYHRRAAGSLTYWRVGRDTSVYTFPGRDTIGELYYKRKGFFMIGDSTSKFIFHGR